MKPFISHAALSIKKITLKTFSVSMTLILPMLRIRKYIMNLNKNCVNFPSTLKGFTLIEVLVAVSVIGILGASLSVILSRTFRENERTGLLGLIHQNGQVAMNTIVDMIRTSDRIVCGQGKILVTVDQNIYHRFRFVDPAGNNNGYISYDKPASLGGSVLDSQYCNTENAPLNSPINITNSSLTSGVSVINGSFSLVNGSSTNSDTVTISFQIQQSSLASTAETTITNPVEFKTTIQLRRTR